jgi:hypothetical protein
VVPSIDRGTIVAKGTKEKDILEEKNIELLFFEICNLISRKLHLYFTIKTL